MADYSYSLRTQCAQLSLPRSEWTHYFVQGLKLEIRECFILQQPDNLESAENYAKLKESVLSTSDKTPTFDAKQMSDRIIQEINRAAASKETQVNALSQQGLMQGLVQTRQNGLLIWRSFQLTLNCLAVVK